MNIFDHLKYRTALETAAKTRKITYRSLAMASRIHTSYFSRVMVGDADFTPSQLHLVAQELKFNTHEIEYLQLLLQEETGQNPAYKNFAREKARTFREEHSKLERRLESKPKKLSENELEVYYREALTAKIHIHFTIEKFQQKPQLVKAKLGLSDAKFNDELEKLSGLGLIQVKKDGTIEPMVRMILLEEANPLSPSNHTNWRLEAIQWLQRREPVPGDYHFSAVFSADEGAKLKIKELFKKFIVEAQKATAESPQDDQVYHIGFDLY